MNAAQLAQRLLVYVDQRTLSEANTAGAEYLNGAVDAINSAMQELYRIVPSIAVRSYGLTTRPMQVVGATMAQYSNQAVLDSYETWMLGQSVSSSSDYKGRIVSKTTTPVPTGNMIVAGAGSAEANGTYLRDGDFNGRPRYTIEGQTSINGIVWDGTQWRINYDEAYYISINDVDSPDLAETWSADTGATPVPTVTAETSAEPLITLTSEAAIAQNSLNIYNDAIALPSEIVAVLSDVVIDNRALLVATTSETQLNSILRLHKTTDYGRPRPIRNQPFSPAPGIPSAYFIDSIATTGNTAAPTRYMRLSPWPVNTHTITFNARIAPANITTADLDAANNGAACTKEIPVPNGWDETYLLPIAMQHFTASPFWNNQAAMPEIRRRYEWTLQTLPLSNPQRDRQVDIYPAI